LRGRGAVNRAPVKDGLLGRFPSDVRRTARHLFLPDLRRIACAESERCEDGRVAGRHLPVVIVMGPRNASGMGILTNSTEEKPNDDEA
jgi:hypothetical protein